MLPLIPRLYANCAMLLVLGTVACRQSDARQDETLQAPVAMTPVKPAVIVVGGCMDACTNAASAVSAFVLALTTRTGNAAMFLDTSRLVVDHQPLGETWARMWKEGQTVMRKDAIRNEVERLASLLNAAHSDRSAVPLDRSLQLIAAGPGAATFRFAPVGLARPWVLTLRPRGIEWLVVEIAPETNALFPDAEPRKDPP